ncbi:N-formyl peptide receptor 2-like [Mobula birostris]|uniref:N-formyl peptide receptor 2-like n=1 Tax=Mobula birostris TaxID=1983395 RepID=UPI003B286360
MEELELFPESEPSDFELQYQVEKLKMEEAEKQRQYDARQTDKQREEAERQEFEVARIERLKQGGLVLDPGDRFSAIREDPSKSLSEGMCNSTPTGNLTDCNFTVVRVRMEWGAPSVMSMVILILTFLLGVLGNAAVIWVTGFKMKSNVHTVCFLNLAVADLTFSLFLPFLMADTAQLRVSESLSVFITSIMLLNFFASVYLLCLISIYRCLAILQPIWFQQNLSFAWVRATCFVVWVIAIGICLLLFFPRYLSERIIIWTVFVFGLPFAIMITCYALVGWRLHGDRFAKARKPIRLIVTAVSAFVICCLPVTLCTLLRNFSESVSQDWLIFTKALASFKSSLNPFVYVFASSDFRQVFRRSLFASLQLLFTHHELKGETQSRNPTSDTNV